MARHGIKLASTLILFMGSFILKSAKVCAHAHHNTLSCDMGLKLHPYRNGKNDISVGGIDGQDKVRESPPYVGN